MFCTNCGTNNADTAKFCAVCGSPMQPTPIPAPQKESGESSCSAASPASKPAYKTTAPEKDKKIVLWIIWGILLGLGVLGALAAIIILPVKYAIERHERNMDAYYEDRPTSEEETFYYEDEPASEEETIYYEDEPAVEEDTSYYEDESVSEEDTSYREIPQRYMNAIIEEDGAAYMELFPDQALEYRMDLDGITYSEEYEYMLQNLAMEMKYEYNIESDNYAIEVIEAINCCTGEDDLLLTETMMVMAMGPEGEIEGEYNYKEDPFYKMVTSLPTTAGKLLYCRLTVDGEFVEIIPMFVLKIDGRWYYHPVYILAGEISLTR